MELTKREQFAAMAMQGYIALGVAAVGEPFKIALPAEELAKMVGRRQREAAHAAVEMADQLIAALRGRTTPD